MTKVKIIGTGLSGLVGSRIVELLSSKYDFVNLSLETGVDITNLSLLDKKFKELPYTKLVLHLAAFTDVSSAWIQNENKNGSCYQVNVIGSKNIAQLCKNYNKYLIHISTDYIFDGYNPPTGGYKETDVPNPIEWYGKTKLWAEQEVQKSGCRNAILRIAFPYKAEFSPKNLELKIKLDLVRDIKAKLESGEKINRFTDQIITPTFIDDIAKVIDKMIKVKSKGIYHCVGSTSLSPYELAIKIADVFKLDKTLINKSSLEEFIKTIDDDRPRQKNLSLSNQKLERELGIKMATIDQGLNKIKNQLIREG